METRYMKFYVKETIRRNKDGDELVSVQISPSMMNRVSYIIFVEKSVKKANLTLTSNRDFHKRNRRT